MIKSFLSLGKVHSGPKVIKLFHTQLSTKFILLINVKMSTFVSILTFVSMINTTSERLKSKNLLYLSVFKLYEQLKFVASCVEHGKSFITSGPVGTDSNIGHDEKLICCTCADCDLILKVTAGHKVQPLRRDNYSTEIISAWSFLKKTNCSSYPSF